MNFFKIINFMKSKWRLSISDLKYSIQIVIWCAVSVKYTEIPTSLNEKCLINDFYVDYMLK